MNVFAKILISVFLGLVAVAIGENLFNLAACGGLRGGWFSSVLVIMGHLIPMGLMTGGIFYIFKKG